MIKLKTGFVNGLVVEARPVPFRLVRRMIHAEQAGDDSAKVLLFAETVAECVTFDEGRPLDIDELDVETIAALYKFAVNPSKETSPDFTAAASTDGTAEESKMPPPTT